MFPEIVSDFIWSSGAFQFGICFSTLFNSPVFILYGAIRSTVSVRFISFFYMYFFYVLSSIAQLPICLVVLKLWFLLLFVQVFGKILFCLLLSLCCLVFFGVMCYTFSVFYMMPLVSMWAYLLYMWFLLSLSQVWFLSYIFCVVYYVFVWDLAVSCWDASAAFSMQVFPLYSLHLHLCLLGFCWCFGIVVFRWVIWQWYIFVSSILWIQSRIFVYSYYIIVLYFQFLRYTSVLLDFLYIWGASCK